MIVSTRSIERIATAAAQQRIVAVEVVAIRVAVADQIVIACTTCDIVATGTAPG